MSFMPSNLALVGFQPEDDIDKLFRQLPQIEPSGELIARILVHIRRLPGPLWQQDQVAMPESEGRLDALVVRNETRDPS
jgi:hypothetical protein